MCVPSVIARAAGAVPRDVSDELRRPPVLPDAFPKVGAIIAPLASVPAIVEAGTTLTVELDPRRVGAAHDLRLSLVPRFGAVRAPTELVLLDVGGEITSPLWRDRGALLVTAAVPSLGGVAEDLYDLRVSWATGADQQPRAVKVVEAYPDKPRFVIVADPSVGDPRPVQEGAEDLVATGSPDSLTDKALKTLGMPPDERMWAAFNKVVDEVNLAAPDFVLVAGDLTFGLYPRPINYEFEEAYRLINRFRVPTFLTPGNHDLYHFDYDHADRPHTTDGKQLWPLYFGPLQYAVDVGPDLHLMSINSFDWPDDQRNPFYFRDDGSQRTRSGGYVSDEQLDWVAEDLRGWRDGNTDGAIVTFAHHNPSWRARRHPWPGLNRLELRDLLAEVRAGAHFAGHTHDDRIARYHEGDIVETNGNNDFPRRELHYMDRDDLLDDSWTQEELAAIIRDPSHGPVFVDTTTAASGLKGPDWGLGSYWGWRLGVLDQRDGGYDPADFGYPATEEFLEAHAERPENYNADHAPLGVFSYPSYYLDEAVEGPNDGTAGRVRVAITSRLLVDLRTVVLVSVAAPDAGSVTVDGGTVVGARSADGVTDLWVEVTVPSEGQAVVEARANTGAYPL